MNCIIPILLMLFSFSVQATTGDGTLTGTVQDRTNKEPIPFASVIVSGTTIGATTDFDGHFFLQLSPGKYDIVISYIGYRTDTLKNVQVIAGQTMELNHYISTDAQMLEAVDLVVKQDRESETALLVNARKATEIVQNIGSQELSRKGVSTVADGLQKVSGISTVSSKFIVVRGLGDRYNAALLNGLPVPSTNPDMKVPELDLFPTNIVSNIKVTKTYASNYYGDYSGGMVDIQTKTYAEEPLLKVGIGSGFNTQTIGREVTTYQGGRYDYFGFDDGGRTTPSTGVNGSEANPYTFTNSLNPVYTNAKPNSSFNLSVGNRKKGENGSVMGYLFSASHGLSNRYSNGDMRIINKQNDIKLDYDFDAFEQSTNSSALATLYFAPNTDTRFTYNFLAVSTSSDLTRETRGSHFDYQKQIYTRRNTFKRNSMYLNQLTFEKEYDQTIINAAVGYSIAQNREPDRNQLVYLYDEGDAPTEYVFNAVDRLENHRFYSHLDEKEMSAMANVKRFLGESKDSNEKQYIDFGIQAKNKTRDFDYQQFYYDLSNFNTYYATVDYRNPDFYLNQENAEKGWISIEEVNNPASANQASLMILAGHANASFWLNPRLQLLPGIRVEYGNQNITFRDQQQPVFLRENELKGISVLPHMGVRFNATENLVYRAAASKTVSRPGFKEVAPFEYTEVFAGAKTRGNPNLQNGQNYNLDLKMEWYPHANELLSVSVFGKYLNDPIEKNMEATASGQLQSYQNADFGAVAGVEFEYNKRLSNNFSEGFMKDLVVGMNVSAMMSTVTIQDEGEASSIVTNPTHPLQGASPILLNVDLSYSPEDKGSITLAYNWFGERLYAVGIQGLGDIYERSYGTLNLIGSYPITEGLNVSFKLNNLLNPSIETVQYNEGSSFVNNAFKRGMDISLGLSWTL